MGRPLNTEQPWFVEAATKMVREDKTFREVVEELKLALTTAECEKYRKQKEFQAILRIERLKYERELANDPERNKATAIGKMLIAINKLEEEGAYDKVAEAVMKLAKIEGWLEADTNVTVYAGLTQKELEAAKEKILDRIKQSDSSEPGTNEPRPN